MRLRKIYWMLFVALAIGCSEESRQTDQQSPQTSTITPTIKPYPTQALAPVVGAYTELIPNPKPNAEGIIILGAGDKLEIAAPQGPVLGYPVLSFTPGGDTVIIRGPGGGQHVEILIDDDETLAHISTSFPIKLAFPNKGTHLVRVYLCASDGECVKDMRLHGLMQVNINDKTTNDKFAAIPTIAYNLPRKRNRARAVVLDYALHGVPLKADGRTLDGYVVRAVIDDTVSKDLVTWQPCDIDGLTAGKHKIKLQLMKVGANGGLTEVTTAYASTTREFEVVNE